MKRKLLIAAGTIPLLGLLGKPPGIMLLIFSVFVYFFLKKNSGWRNLFSNRSRGVAAILTALLVGALTEGLAFLQNYGEGFQKPEQLFIRVPEGYQGFGAHYMIQNIIIGSGYYLGLAAVFFIFTKYFKYSLSAKKAFLTYGLFGIFMEQGGAVAIMAIAAGPIMGPLFMLYTFLVHGSIAGLLWMPLQNRFPAEKNGHMQYLILFPMIFIGVTLGYMITDTIRGFF